MIPLTGNVVTVCLRADRHIPFPLFWHRNWRKGSLGNGSKCSYSQTKLISESNLKFWPSFIVWIRKKVETVGTWLLIRVGLWPPNFLHIWILPYVVIALFPCHPQTIESISIIQSFVHSTKDNIYKEKMQPRCKHKFPILVISAQKNG